MCSFFRLASPACLPGGLYVLIAVICSFFNWRPIISESARPIFMIFLPNNILWIWPSFSDSSRDVTMATNFKAKLADLLLFGRLAFQSGLEYQNASLIAQ